MKHVLDQIRPNSRNALNFTEQYLNEDEINASLTIGTFDNRKDAIIALVAHKRNNKDMTETLETRHTDMWAILSAKAEGEAEEKLESSTQGEGMRAYIRVHTSFKMTTDVGRSMRRAAIMQPPNCTHEHDISAAMERWEEKY